MCEQVISFNPVLPKKPKVLILGSAPSQLSLEKQQYYGNPRNHFWPILFEIFGEDPLSDYSDKISFIKQKGIALWDTIGVCYRKGSLDVNITEEEPNDIIGLIDSYPTIRLIACNGTKSFNTFTKNINLPHGTSIKEVIKLSSSSPIPGKYNKSFAEKVEEWKILKEYL